jgi:CubicO group peptidase (beta-lactamase class C family)
VRRWLARGAVGLVALLAVGYLAAWVATPWSGTARAIAWLEADTGDIDRFPTRAVDASDEPWRLGRGAPVGDLIVEVEGRPEPLTSLLDRTGTEAFLVARGDELLLERYAPGRDRGDLHTSFSVAKSVLATVVGAVIAEGHLDLDDPITDLLPELADRDPRFGEVTVEHLLSMTSGLRYEERGLPWSDDARTYYATDLRELALTGTEVVEPPGRFHYNNYNPLLTGLLVERATREPVTSLLERLVWQPAGMEGDASWSLDSDTSGFEKLESGVNARPVDLLRLGMLHRDGGARPDGRQVLPEGWVAGATTSRASTPKGLGYGLGWWVLDDEVSLAWGNHGQFVLVDGANDVVVVRVGRGYGVDATTWHGALREVAANVGRS